ncbi:Cytochrome P450 superfamily [Verrucomicrobiia bacterium DG1235]|nr:Cytochrome P450 superfamily [Verrucomicrobiae bacterium DG1235]
MPTENANVPSYETDFAGLEPDEVEGLDSFDHVGAYRKLGPIYSVMFRGEKWICMGGVEANEVAWRNPDMWDYRSALSPFRDVMGEKHVTQMDGKAHRQKRRQLKPGFAMSAIARWIPKIDSIVKESLSAEVGSSSSLADFFMSTLTKANAQTVLQTRLSDEAIKVFIRFEETFIGATVRAEEQRNAFYASEGFLADKRFVFKLLGDLVKQRVAALPKRTDDNFSEVLAMTLEDCGGEMDLQELVSEAYLLLMAGTGNTAKLLNCGLQHILADEFWLSELRNELEGYGPGSFARGMDGFPKLKATVFEIERMFPAAPVLARVVAKPFEFLGHHLEKGDKVLHLQTLPHFLDEVYEEPYRFKPMRWIENKYSKKSQGTFGGSTHICLGMNLARIHMPIVLANVLSGYELEQNSKSEIKVNLNYGVPQVSDISGRFLKRA